MRNPHAFPCSPPAAFALLTAALLLPACAPKENPIMPPSIGRGGISSTTRIDGSAASEAGQTLSDANADASTAEEVASDTLVGAACHPPSQDCPTADLACYPLPRSDRGQCQSRRNGVLPEATGCVVGQRDVLCMPGYDCISHQAADESGSCYKMCDLTEAVSSYCGFGYTCAQRNDLPATSILGYCLPA